MILSSTCGIILIVWGLVSILNQFQLKINSKIASFDPYSLIPQWSFFAPNPGTFDYHLLFRDDGEDLDLNWQEIPLLYERTKISFLWNPNKRLNKALFDMTETLKQIELREKDNKNFIYISLPYLYLLNLVLSQPNIKDNSNLRQFIIVRNYGRSTDKENEIVFISKIHMI